VRDLTLISGHEGIARAIHDRKAPTQVVVRVTAHGVTIERVRLVLLDLRPQVPAEKRQDLQIYDAALHLVAPGRANLAVRDSEFHSAGAGIEIGTLGRGHTDDGFPDPSTDYVSIEKCVFRGYSPGFYKEPTHPASYQHMGIFNEGVQVFNGKYVIIQGCDFAGADRRGGKMMNRSICVCNTSVRDLYIADNRSHDVGMVCLREDRAVNQDEQILFHFMYPHGGYFDVLEAGPAQVTVDPQDSRNAGKLTSPHMVFDRAASRVLDEVGTNDHWVVFVSAGKGVGQYRVVIGADRKPNRTVLNLDYPWRVVPDRSSRITLTTANRQNLIVGNTIDADFIDSRCKVAGILFWFNGFENVIAGNTLRNLGYGIGFNSSFRNPCCWNLIRDNAMERMGGMARPWATPEEGPERAVRLEYARDSEEAFRQFPPCPRSCRRCRRCRWRLRRSQPPRWSAGRCRPVCGSTPSRSPLPFRPPTASHSRRWRWLGSTRRLPSPCDPSAVPRIWRLLGPSPGLYVE
jgi:hypothetical protein